MAGDSVLIGSRDAARASEAAALLATVAPGARVSAALNDTVAREADPVFVTVPYGAHRTTLSAVADSLAGKTVVDVVAPLAFSKGVARAVHVPEGSAALEAQAILPGATVVAAFHTISAHDLLDPNSSVDSDVIVCSNDPDGRRRVMALAEKIPGIRAVNGGGLHNAVYVENLTALLLNINRLYKARSAIRIVGI
jgi:NADPH-dependent F420 reductase